MNLVASFNFEIAFFLQGILLLIDELLFHYRRDVPKWERWGHPLDTLTVMIPYAFLYFAPDSVKTYAALAFVSCIFITKDEWVHQKFCTPMEHWLHAVLFILHPIVFFLGYSSVTSKGHDTLIVPIFILVAFMTYQILYWNQYDKRNRYIVD